MKTWPSWWPNCTVDFSQKVKASVSRTQMEAGIPRQRPREIENQRMLNVSWEFDKQQFSEFQSFFKYSLSNGCDWFNLTVPVSGEMESKVVRFVDGTFDHKHTGILYATVSATLETRDQCEAYTADEIEALLLVGGYDAFHAAVEALEAAEALYP